ncbi:hypothetical protein COCNU_scaffold008850G000030 [Cocos nucifera]|nr:hypothetical protein [Cocos nucifera]
MSFQDQKKGTIFTFLEVGHFLSVIIKSATNNKAKVTKVVKNIEVAKAKTSDHKVEVEHLKEVLREVERTLAETKEELATSKSALEKAKSNLASKKEKRKVAEFEAAKVKKKKEKKVAETRHLVVEEFKSSKKLTTIKVQLVGKAFEVGGDDQAASSWRGVCRISSYTPYFNVDTDIVVGRLISSVYPMNDFTRKIDGNPDLYGPIWISTTLVFMLAAVGNHATFKEEQGLISIDDKISENFDATGTFNTDLKSLAIFQERIPGVHDVEGIMPCSIFDSSCTGKLQVPMIYVMWVALYDNLLLYEILKSSMLLLNLCKRVLDEFESNALYFILNAGHHGMEMRLQVLTLPGEPNGLGERTKTP